MAEGGVRVATDKKKYASGKISYSSMIQWKGRKAKPTFSIMKLPQSH